MTRETQIISVFGECEAVIARVMSGEKGLRIIPPAEIPESAATNNFGQRAQFAIVMPHEHLVEFNRRVARLRA